MLRLLLLPMVGIGAIFLLSGQFGTGTLPSTMFGLPSPMVLFVGLSAFIIASLRTT